MGLVTEISALERQVISLTIRGLKIHEIAVRTKLKIRSIEKLLENVDRKIGTARLGEFKRSNL